MSEQPVRPTMELTNAEFVTAISHFFRGEMARANVWRRRLDTTTNWAVVTTAAFLSLAFGSHENTHFVIILATVFVLFFLSIESRRYKYFDLWRWRVALVNENFFACVIEPSKPPMFENWRELLSEDLQHSRFKISFAEAFGRRLRRNYGWIFFVLGGCWFIKIAIHPTLIGRFSEIFERADIYHLIPGWLVLTVGVLFNGALLVIAVKTLKPREEVVRIYPAKKSRVKMLNI